MTTDSNTAGIELQTGPSPSWAVIWLHGLGADGHDFEPIVPELVKPHWPAIRFVFPHAPVQPVTINGGMRMRSWYDILGFAPDTPQDEAGIRASASVVERLIAREVERGIPTERIILAGFSQGGVIVLTAGLRHASPLGGIVALSTYLALDDTLADEASPANRTIPIFMAHGTHDPVIVLPRAQASRTALEVHGYDIQWRTYPMQHSVCAEEVADLTAWFEARFAL
ncbi:carboxylesterase [Xanthomonadaceae bacterium JHOS43]|nr:carboxylesterase [Xanthomonadaceae bacterium JHOS43]MCX7562234.1 carboxylesterase [Xanthomonadaceae bacterium XH05]